MFAIAGFRLSDAVCQGIDHFHPTSIAVFNELLHQFDPWTALCIMRQSPSSVTSKDGHAVFDQLLEASEVCLRLLFSLVFKNHAGRVEINIVLFIGRQWFV